MEPLSRFIRQILPQIFQIEIYKIIKSIMNINQYIINESES